MKVNKGKIFVVGGIIILLIVIIGAGGKGNEGISTATAEKGSVSDVLLLTGEARPVKGAEMAFTMSGTVEQVFKQAGDKISMGEKIIELDNASLRADLSDAVATLALARAEAKVSNAELDQDVQNAYARLLSDDLQAYSKDSNTNSDAPVISGSYKGNVEGEYKITIQSSNDPSGKAFRYSGLESGFTPIVYYKAIPLGTKGLFIKFTDGETATGDVWRVSIPNVEGDSYVTNYNAYQSALASRDAAEKDNISEQISNAKVQQAEAGVARIQAEINERILRAPFSGVVSKVDIKKGEQAVAGVVVTGVITDDAYEVIVEVPESDVVGLEQGLPVSITLDAYGSDAVFPGTLSSIDPAETEVDGVSVYRGKVVFTEADGRIRSGMTATVNIVKAEVVDVVRIPERYIEVDDEGIFVNVLKDEEEIKMRVVTGLYGSDGFVEIKEGVSEGDVIIGHFAE